MNGKIFAFAPNGLTLKTFFLQNELITNGLELNPKINFADAISFPNEFEFEMTIFLLKDSAHLYFFNFSEGCGLIISFLNLNLNLPILIKKYFNNSFSLY